MSYLLSSEYKFRERNHHWEPYSWGFYPGGIWMRSIFLKWFINSIKIYQNAFDRGQAARLEIEKWYSCSLKRPIVHSVVMEDHTSRFFNCEFSETS